MKKVFLIMSIVIVFIGMSILIYSIYQDKQYQNKDKELIEDFFDNYDNSSDTIEEPIKEDDNNYQEPDYSSYLAVIEIPSISLKTGIVMSNSNYTTMNRNVSIYPSSDMPDVKNGNFILFAHNGTSRVSYFRNIYKLKNGNDIYIYYNNQQYTYRVIRQYDVAMTDSTPLNKMKDNTIITLITCKSGNNKYRTIIVGELVK